MQESEPGRSAEPVTVRLWRARRRHHHIDAMVGDTAAGCELAFLRDNRVLVTWTCADREAAIADAERRLGELLRAGWSLHW